MTEPTGGMTRSLPGDDAVLPQSVWSNRTASRAPGVIGTSLPELAEQLFRLITAGTYRKGSLTGADSELLFRSVYPALLRRVRLGEPIQLTLMAFPFKVPNPAKAGDRRLPDLAELAAVQRLRDLARRVRSAWPAGLRIAIIHDGRLLGELFGLALDEVVAYEEYFSRLIGLAGAQDDIVCHDFTSLQQATGLTPDGDAVARLEQEACDWWHAARDTPGWRECFRKTLGMMNLRSLPHQVAGGMLSSARVGRLPEGHSQLECRVHRAMMAYHAKDAIIHRFDPRPVAFPDAIHATTRQQPGRLALWLIRRGHGLLPWHGAGMIDRCGTARVMLVSEIARRPNFSPLFLEGEDTPFCFGTDHQPDHLRRLIRA
jgi:hypothetical protein